MNTLNTAAIITSSVVTTEGLLDMNTASGVSTSISNLAYYVPLLFTNVVATSLIGYKFWYFIPKPRYRILGTHCDQGNIVGKLRSIWFRRRKEAAMWTVSWSCWWNLGYFIVFSGWATDFRYLVLYPDSPGTPKIISMLSGVSIMGALGAEILECLLPQISVCQLDFTYWVIIRSLTWNM